MSIASNFPAIKPTLLLDFSNTKELDSRVTFTRASTATYYGTQTAKAEENLLLQSQTFDSASWVKTSATVTADSTTAPDGTTTADLVYPTTTGTNRGFYQSGTAAYLTTAVAKVFSIYAKASGISHIYLQDTNAGAQRTWFNVSAGTVGTTAASTTASITDVGNGWYRCVVTTSIAWGAGAFLGWQVADADNSTTATTSGTNGVLLWGAQLEQRSAVTAYTATTTQPITNYIPQLLTAASGVARFDHNPTTFESLGLEIEEQRTNLVTYSEQFDNAAWTKSNATITANTVIAPDGTLTGDKLVENTADSTHTVSSPTIAVSAGAMLTQSYYFKAAERTLVAVRDSSVATTRSVFDLTSGTVVSTGAASTVTISNVGNGWYRCTNTYTTTTTSSTPFVELVVSGTTISYTGNGFSGIYIWGAQLEAGAFATSYIPTVASQVTRAADAASMTGTNFSSWYNQGEGTLYADWSAAPPVVSTLRGLAAIGQTTTGNDIILSVGNNVANYIILSEGASQANLNSTATSSQTGGKVAVGYKVNDFAVVANNGTASTDALGILPSNPTQMRIGAYGGNPGTLCGTIRKIAYYPLRVTNAQLQGLTS